MRAHILFFTKYGKKTKKTCPFKKTYPIFSTSSRLNLEEAKVLQKIKEEVNNRVGTLLSNLEMGSVKFHTNVEYNNENIVTITVNIGSVPKEQLQNIKSEIDTLIENFAEEFFTLLTHVNVFRFYDPRKSKLH